MEKTTEGSRFCTARRIARRGGAKQAILIAQEPIDHATQSILPPSAQTLATQARRAFLSFWLSSDDRALHVFCRVD